MQLQKSCLVFILFFSLNSYAFLNIESIRRSTKMGFLGSTGAKISGKSGNTDKLSTSFSTLNAHKSKKSEYLMLGTYQYGESSNKKDTNEGHIHLRKAHYWNEKWGGEIFTQLQFDEFEKLNLRTLVGAGFRNALSVEEKSSLHLGFGAFYEVEELDSFEDEETVRGNFYLSWIYDLEKNLKTSIVTYYQPSVETLKDYRLKIDFGLEVMITEMFSFSSELFISHDSRPPGSVEKTDVSYLAGIFAKY